MERLKARLDQAQRAPSPGAPAGYFGKSDYRNKAFLWAAAACPITGFYPHRGRIGSIR